MFSPDNKISRGRFYTLAVLILAAFTILGGRFYQLQIYQHQKFVSRAEANRIREVAQPGPRGLIFDRHGRLLVDNRFTYVLSVIPWEIRRSPKVMDELDDFLATGQGKLKERLKNTYRGAFTPARLASGLDFETISLLAEHRLELPGVILSYDPIRFYPTEAKLSHVLGYLREIDPNSLDNMKRSNYQLGDLVGWNGLEQEYEPILRGKKGIRYMQVNARGQEIGSVPDRKPVLPRPGHNLYLTIDAELQAYAESLFVNDSIQGAVVAIEPGTGEVLTLMSSPQYDLSLFSGAIEVNDWRTLQSDTTRPLYNRAVVGAYPPGSTFKIVTAVAALQEGIITPDWTVFDPGYYRLGRRIFRCWKPGGHGKVNLYSAIEQSCNVYFYTLIRKVGIDNWAKYAEMFGFGSRTQIDLPDESPGILPDRTWMDKHYGKGRWTEGHLLNMTVGQGNVLATPLQVAHFAAILATGGTDATPHLGLAYETENEELEKFKYSSHEITAVSQKTFQEVMKGMLEVVNGEHGTAKAAQVPGATVFGKTGSAQNPHGQTHAWFMGGMRSDNLALAIAVFVENGGSGGGNAAPIAGKIFKKYLELEEAKHVPKSPGFISQNLKNEQ